jgi:hypothetical protein
MNANVVMAPAWFMIAIVGIAVVAGIVLLIRAITRGSGRNFGLFFAGLIAVCFLLTFVGYRVQRQPQPQQVVREQYLSEYDHHAHPVPDRPFSTFAKPPIQVTPDTVKRTEVVKQESEVVRTVGDATKATDHSHEPELPAASPPKTSKPAWLTQGTQTGNGTSQFPISSELFATVAECQRDLDRRMPALIAEELRFLIGSESSITLLPGEDKRLTAETFTEEVPTTSQGNWYKVHRLVKVDETAWAGLRDRFHQANVHARLSTLGISFGGLMLVLGVVYLILRRSPRNVDPALNTFSTT